MGKPRHVFHLFSSIQPITNLTTNKYMKKCPSSIRCQDLNARPLDHDSLPITTRSGLLPSLHYFNKCNMIRITVIVAQLVERLLPRDTRFESTHRLFTVNCIEKKKRPGMVQ